eukprot:scaffold495694_cov149-Attheya_sp.AAC.1
MRTKKTDKGLRCDSCQEILKSSMIKNIKKIIHTQGADYQRAETISLSPTLTDSDAIFIITINEQSDFGDMVVKAAGVQCCDTLQKQGTGVILLNTAVDGVSSESHFCRRQISSFLDGKSNILGL